jgi:hypothetical protein
MKKLIYLIVLALILGLVLTGCLLSNVGQVPTSEQGGITYLTKTVLPLLFSDDFNDGNADGWTPVGSGGDWAVEDDASFGSMVYSQEDTTYTTTSTYDTYWRSYGTDSWTNYTFKTKIKIVSGGGLAPIAGIFFRVQGTDLTSGYYMFRIDARLNTGPALIKSPNTILAGGHPGYPQFVNEPAVIGQIYTLKVIVEGSNIKCYVDDVMKIEFTDNTYLTGRVGVGTFNAHTHFDDVLISDIYYTWTGFFTPVENLPKVNEVKAGRAIPVKFSLNGDQGLDIFALGYPKSVNISCGSADQPVNILDGDTVTAGESSLRYDADAGQYIYVWKTEKSWFDTCRQLVVKLIDGTYHRANFTFTK